MVLPFQSLGEKVPLSCSLDYSSEERSIRVVFKFPTALKTILKIFPSLTICGPV